LKLEDIITKPGEPGFCGSIKAQRLASVFLFKRGHLRRYLELLQEEVPKPFQTRFEAAFEKSFAEIEPQWQSYLADVLSRLDAVQRYPSSRIYMSKEEFDQAAEKYGFDLTTQPFVLEGLKWNMAVVPYFWPPKTK
jgi:hypothetical protein